MHCIPRSQTEKLCACMAAAGNSSYPFIYRRGNGFEEHAAVEDAAFEGALTIKSYQGYYKLHGPIKSVTSSSVEKVEYIYHSSYMPRNYRLSGKGGEPGGRVVCGRGGVGGVGGEGGVGEGWWAGFIPLIHIPTPTCVTGRGKRSRAVSPYPLFSACPC